jgi:formate hydrogenlyase subunit 3/multisubunit Na+/H+ antiporter MnhD subunit
MSAPNIWIIFPGIVAVILFLLRRQERAVLITGTATCLWLSWVAGQLPIGVAMTFGQFSFKVSETLSILGREFILVDADRPFLSLLYLLSAIWLLGAFYGQPGGVFVPFAMGMVSLLTAALAVEPFLYAALIFEITALLAIPLLVPPGLRPGRGVFRFLAFQTFGMPFILFTGWMLAGVEASPGDLDLVVRAGVLLGIGFAFLLAVFPFHSWIPMLAEEAHPYIAVFIFFMLPGMVSLFGLGFLDRYTWLRESEAVLLLLRSVGMVMAVVGGLWAAFETHLGRMLGFAVVVEMGLNLLAIGLGDHQGVVIYFWLVLSRVVALVLWAIALTRIRSRMKGDLRFDGVRGLGRYRPLSSATLLIAHFSMAGLPLLAGFPVRLALWQHLADLYPVVAGGAILGSVGLLVGGLRTMETMFIPIEQEDPFDEDEPKTVTPLSKIEPERLLNWAFFAMSVGVLLVIGLFPQKLLPFLNQIAEMFQQFGG